MKTLLLTATMVCAANVANAHVTLDQSQAPAGSTYKAALRVGHGCEGSPTRALTVRLPDAVRGAKPMPKAGWRLSLQEGSGGRVEAVTWTAATPADMLPDAHYDEFIVRVQLPELAGPLWFKVMQQCERGQKDWSEVPASGASTKGLEAPAALLNVVPAAPAAAPHH